MPTFRQLLGEDRNFMEIGWIARRQAIDMLSNTHEYLKARQALESADVADALLLVHGTILELQLEVENGLEGEPKWQ